MFEDTGAVQSNATFTYGGNRPARWVNAPNPWAWGLRGNGWDDDHLPIAAIDPASQTITMAGCTTATAGLPESPRAVAVWREPCGNR